MLTHPLTYLGLGLASLYVGERVLSGSSGLVTDAVGALFVALALALAVLRRARAADDARRRAAGRLIVAYAVVALASVLYALPTHLLAGELSPKAHAVLMVVWPALLLAGLLPAVAMERALRSMERAPTLELWRLGLAARAAIIAVFALVAFAGLNFAAAQWNRKIDLSYFKTTKPGEVTLKLVEDLSEPVQVLLFYPPGNEVLEDLRAYFGTLAEHNGKLAIETADQALEPELAKKYKVRTNGSVVLARGERTETLSVGVDREDARSVLKKLDSEVQERLMKVVRAARVAYFTTGHGERDWSPAQGDKRYGLGDFKGLLESTGFSVKRLGLVEGLGKQVPADASLVVVAGPTEPMALGEREALTTYIQGGGHVWILLDPDQGLVDNELVAPLGLKVQEGLVAADKLLVRVDDKRESPYNFVTARMGSHPSTKTLSQNSTRMATAFIGTGALAKLEPAPANLKIAFTVHSDSAAWIDAKNNGTFDKDEKRAVQELVAAVESTTKSEDGKTGLRALVTADADVIGNGIIRNAGNAYLVLDGVKWLVGDEALAGKVESEEDVAIEHRKEEDTAWFYGTSFVVPAAVLGFGLVVTRRTRRRRGDA
jgi:hypothetical protein